MGADDFNLGRHEALIRQLVKGQTDIFERLGSIEEHLAEKRGERRVAIWTAGAVGGLLGTIVPLILRVFHA